jgi:integrase/recombinase XerD
VILLNTIKQFQEFLLEKDKSSKTIEAYVRDIQQFYKYLRTNNIKEIHNDTLKSYKNYLLHERFLTATTVNRKLVALHQYLSFNEISATTNIVKIQSQNFLENVLDKSEVDKMVDIAKRKNDLRAIALFKTLSNTGMRISEALSLTINDIHKDSVEIVGKGNKRRMVFIPKSLNKIWLQYCRNGRYHTKLDYLFVTQKGKMTRETADKIVKKYGNLCNIPIEKCHCHSFRHMYCKRLGDNPNITIDIIADLAGHQDISVTRRYLRKSKSELLSIIEDLD